MNHTTLIRVSIFLALFVACAVLSTGTPQVSAFDSPLPTLEPPPFRATPTSGAPDPVSRVKPGAGFPEVQQQRGFSTALAAQPTATVAPRVVRIVRVIYDKRGR